MKKCIKRLAVLLTLGLCSFGLFACDKNTPSPQTPPEPSGEKTFTIKWVDNDGNVIETDSNVKEGTIPEFNGEVPSKENDDKYQYKFRSWYPVVLPAAGDVTYVADYTPRRVVTTQEGIEKDWYDSTLEWVMKNKKKYLNGVPGGGAVCAVFDKLFDLVGVNQLESVDPFDEIKDKIDNLQDTVTEGFSNVETLITQETERLSQEIRTEINQAERNLETVVLSQTAIANKGDSFDSLLTAMKSTERSLEAIIEDKTMSKQDRALSVARLIGGYDKWNDSSNLFASYLSVLDAITKATYSTTYDKLLFDFVYDQQMLHSSFTSEAISRGAPYVEKIIYLAFYAYSICQECLSAAATVANFTAADLNNLSATNKQIYASIVSPYSVIVKQSDYLNSKVCELGFEDDSVMDRVINYFDYSNKGGILLHLDKGDSGIRLSDELNVETFGPDKVKNPRAAVEDMSFFYGELFYDESESMKVINHFKQYYSGVTFREYLSMLGYDMTNVAQNAYFMIIPYGDDNFTYAGYKGLNIDSTSGDIENINVKNSSGQGQTTVAVMFKKP